MQKEKERETVPAAPLLRYIREQGLTQADFAKQVHQSPQTITNWKSRGIPKGELLDVARAMRVSVEQYLRLAGEPSLKQVAARWRAAMKTPDGAVAVPVFDIGASMGQGRIAPVQEAVVGGISLSREWMRAHLPQVTSLSNLAVISAFGDSMSPTFNDGDILLVDQGVSEAKIDAVFVIGRGDELFVKRVVRRLNGDLLIRSDNPLFEPETVKAGEIENVRVLGRVVWAWNGRRL